MTVRPMAAPAGLQECRLLLGQAGRRCVAEVDVPRRSRRGDLRQPDYHRGPSRIVSWHRRSAAAASSSSCGHGRGAELERQRQPLDRDLVHVTQREDGLAELGVPGEIGQVGLALVELDLGPLVQLVGEVVTVVNVVEVEGPDEVWLLQP